MKSVARASKRLTLSPSVADKIVKRCRTTKAVVVVSNKGRPSRVYDFEKYVERIERTKAQKPWTRRKTPPAPDPLGAVSGKVLAKLSRKDIYD